MIRGSTGTPRAPLAPSEPDYRISSNQGASRSLGAMTFRVQTVSRTTKPQLKVRSGAFREHLRGRNAGSVLLSKAECRSETLRVLPQVRPLIFHGTMNGNHPGGPGTGPNSRHPNATAAAPGSRLDASGPELFQPTLSPISMAVPPKAELTNLVRVPFGMRRPKRQRPQRPDHWATVVIPFQLGSDPTPPPQAA